MSVYLKKWREPRVIIAIVLLVVTAVAAYTTLGNRVSANTEDIGALSVEMEKLPDTFMRTDLAEKEFGHIDKEFGHIREELTDGKEDRRLIKRALGIPVPRRKDE